MIEATGLTKRYGDKVAVDDLSFAVQPGTVTGFLGPNGAGKSTTFRCILGLDRPTSGRVTVNGRSYGDIRAPLHEVGALLEARSVHPGRSARNHLRMLAATHGISGKRVDEVLGLVGIEDVADRRVGGFSLGMGQRLGVAVEADGLDVAGTSAAAIGDLAFAHGIVLHELTAQEATLEEAYMQLTAEDVEFAAGGTG